MTMKRGSSVEREYALVDIFETIAQTLVDECGVPREKITLDSHAVDDLGLDSISFLDLCYGLDMKLHITIPFAELVNDINSGRMDPKDAFVIRNLVAKVEALVQEAAKSADYGP